jgi:hypothetical protein
MDVYLVDGMDVSAQVQVLPILVFIDTHGGLCCLSLGGCHGTENSNVARYD